MDLVVTNLDDDELREALADEAYPEEFYPKADRDNLIKGFKLGWNAARLHDDDFEEALIELHDLRRAYQRLKRLFEPIADAFCEFGEDLD